MPNLKSLAQTVPEIWRGSQNFKSRSRDPFPTPFDLIFSFLCYCPRWSICLPNLMFLAQTVPEIWRGSQNFKSRSRDPFPSPLWLNFSFLSLVPPVVNLHAKFEVSSSNRWSICMPNLKFLAQTVPEIWRGSQNFKSRSRDPLPTPFDLILHY